MLVTYQVDVNGILKVLVENPGNGNAVETIVNRVNLEEDLKISLSTKAEMRRARQNAAQNGN